MRNEVLAKAKILIGSNNLDEAIKLLFTIHLNQREHDETVLLKGRYTSFKKASTNGILDTRDQSAMQNQIALAALGLIDSLKDEQQAMPMVEELEPTTGFEEVKMPTSVLKSLSYVLVSTNQIPPELRKSDFFKTNSLPVLRDGKFCYDEILVSTEFLVSALGKFA